MDKADFEGSGPQGASWKRILFILQIGLLLFVGSIAFFASYGKNNRERSEKITCRINLQVLMIGMIQYSNEHRYFPHMTESSKPHTEQQVSDVFRTLIYYGYVGSAESYICPGSENKVAQRVDLSLKNCKQWDWQKSVNQGAAKPPIQSSSQLSVFDNNELSYTYSKKRMRGGPRSGAIICADKAIGNSQTTAPSFHGNGFNVGYGDGHCLFHTVEDAEIMSDLKYRLVMGDFDPSH